SCGPQFRRLCSQAAAAAAASSSASTSATSAAEAQKIRQPSRQLVGPGRPAAGAALAEPAPGSLWCAPRPASPAAPAGLADAELVDLGCGGGLLAEPLARLGVRVLGVDPVAESVEAASSRRQQSAAAESGIADGRLTSGARRCPSWLPTGRPNSTWPWLAKSSSTSTTGRNFSGRRPTCFGRAAVWLSPHQPDGRLLLARRGGLLSGCSGWCRPGLTTGGCSSRLISCEGACRLRPGDPPDCRHAAEPAELAAGLDFRRGPAASPTPNWLTSAGRRRPSSGARWPRLGVRVLGVDPVAESVEAASSRRQQSAAAESGIADGRLTFRCQTVSRAGCRPDRPNSTWPWLAKSSSTSTTGRNFSGRRPTCFGRCGCLVVTTINGRRASYWLGVVAAERLLRLVPPGTHDWRLFIPPDQLRRRLADCGLETRLTVGNGG
uniref:Methyltransf_11 domain-containing protein n=1 Tax=Macrostomum lignano TaxID=282301 RepID=A0A1I8FQ29_9PLAT